MSETEEQTVPAGESSDAVESLPSLDEDLENSLFPDGDEPDADEDERDTDASEED